MYNLNKYINIKNLFLYYSRNDNVRKRKFYSTFPLKMQQETTSKNVCLHYCLSQRFRSITLNSFCGYKKNLCIIPN